MPRNLRRSIITGSVGVSARADDAGRYRAECGRNHRGILRSRTPECPRRRIGVDELRIDGCEGAARAPMRDAAWDSASPSQERVQGLTVAATRGEPRSIVKHHHVLTAERRFDGLDPIDV